MKHQKNNDDYQRFVTHSEKMLTYQISTKQNFIFLNACRGAFKFQAFML